MSISIRTNNLTKKFKVHKKEPGLKGTLKALFRRKWIEKTALDSCNISIEGGEIVGLIGANGAGKTTLVKMLSGIVYPTSGDATVLGLNPNERSYELRKQIALIMGQKAQLWWDLPADDGFLLLKEIYQIPEEEFTLRKKELTQVLEVEHLLNIQMRRLSLGERMKMELIAALLHRPKVIFLDEPTIGLDLTAQRAIRKFIRDYQQKEGAAVILTSHYMDDIEELCKRIIILREGKIVYDGPLRDVTHKFAKDKVLSLTFEPGTNLDVSNLNSYGEVLAQSPDTLKIKVIKDNVSSVAAEFLQKYKVIDLSIEDTDISDIIEAILREKGEHVLR